VAVVLGAWDPFTHIREARRLEERIRFDPPELLHTAVRERACLFHGARNVDPFVLVEIDNPHGNTNR
jgi:hypothetical protein